MTAGFDAFKDWAVWFFKVNLVPANLRHFDSIFCKPHHAAFKNTEAGGAGIEFFTPFKQRLITYANPEKRFAGSDETFGGRK